MDILIAMVIHRQEQCWLQNSDMSFTISLAINLKFSTFSMITRHFSNCPMTSPKLRDSFLSECFSECIKSINGLLENCSDSKNALQSCTSDRKYAFMWYLFFNCITKWHGVYWDDSACFSRFVIIITHFFYCRTCRSYLTCIIRIDILFWSNTFKYTFMVTKIRGRFTPVFSRPSLIYDVLTSMTGVLFT